MDARTPMQNRLLASLRPADYELLGPHLRTIELVHKTTLYEPGQPMHRVYFPHGGIISLVVRLTRSETLEVGTVGRDSFIGGAFALGGPLSINQATVQIPGVASAMESEKLRKAAEASVSLRTMLFQHERAMLFQTQQSAACNISHGLEARLARALLRSRDLTGSDDLECTQEYLAQMLGVRRTSVSLIASKFKGAGLIGYRRGHLHIQDHKALRERACECYKAVHTHYKTLEPSSY